MTMRDLERATWQEAKVVFNNPKLRLKDLLEWSTGDVKPESDDEVVAILPELRLSVCIDKKHDKRS